MYLPTDNKRLQTGLFHSTRIQVWLYQSDLLFNIISCK